MELTLKIFDEEDDITGCLNCEKCSYKLDMPYQMPCGPTICSNCMTVFQSLKNNRNELECDFCKDFHQLPKKRFSIESNNKNNIRMVMTKLKSIA